MYRSVTAAVVGNIEKDGGHIMTSHMFKGVKDGAVVVNSLASGYDLDVPADACVIAMGVHPDETIADAFEAAFDRVAVVGDTANPETLRMQPAPAMQRHSYFDLLRKEYA